MTKVIKEFDGRLGKIRLIKYEEDGRTEYHVKHEHKAFQNDTWFLDRTEAVKCYQFMCAKY